MTRNDYLGILTTGTKMIIETSHEQDSMSGLFPRVLWMTQGVVDCAKNDHDISGDDYIAIIRARREIVDLIDIYTTRGLDDEED